MASHESTATQPAVSTRARRTPGKRAEEETKRIQNRRGNRRMYQSQAGENPGLGRLTSGEHLVRQSVCGAREGPKLAFRAFPDQQHSNLERFCQA
jgi:hypothetical protein